MSRFSRTANRSIALLLLAAGVPVSAHAQEDQSGSQPLAGAKATQAQPVPSTEAKSDRPTVGLPNGASSINETYGDWSVACSIIDNQKACTFSQAQGNTQTGQRTFAVELRAPSGGKTDGVLLMPFGLKLDDGVRLKIDDQNLGQGAHFSTCIPQGCLVPVSFPTAATDALRKGTNLVINATNMNGGEPPVITVSLNGFTAAMNRVADLSK